MALMDIQPHHRNGLHLQFPAQLLQQATHDDVITVLAMVFCSLTCLIVGRLWTKTEPYHHKLFEKPRQRLGASLGVARSSDLHERLEAEGSDIAMLWASQSGTAERMASRLAKELRRTFGAKTSCIDVSDVSPASLANVGKNKVIIFLASTFGEGDPSDNMHQLWSWLRESKNNSLSNLGFLAFGLGNSNYKYYNHVIDVVVQELLNRGATMLLETGKADDAAGETEEHFLDWKQKVFHFFQTSLHYERQEARYEPSLGIVETASLLPVDLWCGIPFTGKKISKQSMTASLPIVHKKVLSQQSPGRTCLHLDLDIGHSSKLKYKTGDYLSVWPVNPVQETELLVRTLGLEDKQAMPININSLDSSKVHIPSPTTLGALLQSYLETCAPIPRESVSYLLEYAPTTAARAFLTAIANDKSTYATFLKTQYLNLGRLLSAACPEPGAWKSVPLSLVLEVLPPIQPRSYSISSSSVVSPRQISITVAVSDTTTTESSERVVGVASNYLLSTANGDHPFGLTYRQALERQQIHAAVRKSTFKLPMVSSTPVIMVGAGTGVAPFRAFVQERARLKSIGRPVGTTRLFFGCRNVSQDCLYAEEFAEWAEQLGDCFSMTTSFSRPGHGEDKRYIQDAILEYAGAISKLLFDENAYFYICGSAAIRVGDKPTANTCLFVYILFHKPTSS